MLLVPVVDFSPLFPGDSVMAKFLMFGKYSPDSLKGASAARTKKALGLVKKFQGQVDAMYATLGPHDLVVVASFPDTAEAMRASIALTKLTGIGFTTAPAVPVEEFDKLLAEA
jgi:uncharacterized protein with GYD domain